MTPICRTPEWRTGVVLLSLFLYAAMSGQSGVAAFSFPARGSPSKTAAGRYFNALSGRWEGPHYGSSCSRLTAIERRRRMASGWCASPSSRLVFSSTPPTRLDMVADVPGRSTSRPMLPAERDINETVNGFNAAAVDFLKGIMVRYYGERTFARFYALETIARVPYFGYLCVLHLYETLGQWRQAEYLKVHFAESYNELHHLLIMEELGGNVLFWDRWFAQHAAFFYFFVVVVLYLSNPRNAYNLNQHVEEHAFSTYDAFLAENENELKEQPAPQIAKKYYGKDKLYVFNGLHNDLEGATFEESDRNRPTISNLFDTFVAIRNDEWEHVKTMKALQKDVSLERTTP